MWKATLVYSDTPTVQLSSIFQRCYMIYPPELQAQKEKIDFNNSNYDPQSD